MNENESVKTEGDDNSESLDILQKLKADAFDSDDEKLALAMGRPIEEIKEWLGGAEIDEDAQEKIHGLAQQRLSE